MFALGILGVTDQVYKVRESSAGRHSAKCFAMIFVYLTSLTRKNLHKAVAGDDYQD